MKFVVVTLPPLIAAPPPISFPSPPPQPTVTVWPAVAAVGPLTSLWRTFTVAPLMLMLLPLQMAYAYVVLSVLPPPPFQPTALQESGLVSPSAAAF